MTVTGTTHTHGIMIRGTMIHGITIHGTTQHGTMIHGYMIPTTTIRDITLPLTTPPAWYMLMTDLHTGLTAA